MKTRTVYEAADGRRFDNRAEAEAHELREGYRGPVDEHLRYLQDSGRMEDSQRARSLRRNAIVAFLKWQEKQAKEEAGGPHLELHPAEVAEL